MPRPGKEETVWVNVRLERELHEAIKEAADADDRTVSSYVRQTLRRSVAGRTPAATITGGSKHEEKMG